MEGIIQHSRRGLHSLSDPLVNPADSRRRGCCFRLRLCVCLSVCVSVCVCVCQQNISETNKPILTKFGGQLA